MNQHSTKLLTQVEKTKTAFMCAEKFYFHCHRRFIADELQKLGWQVNHIVDFDKTYPHLPIDSLPLEF